MAPSPPVDQLPVFPGCWPRLAWRSGCYRWDVDLFAVVITGFRVEADNDLCPSIGAASSYSNWSYWPRSRRNGDSTNSIALCTSVLYDAALAARVPERDQVSPADAHVTQIALQASEQLAVRAVTRPSTAVTSIALLAEIAVALAPILPFASVRPDCSWSQGCA
jgi:hypothetical protein